MELLQSYAKPSIFSLLFELVYSVIPDRAHQWLSLNTLMLRWQDGHHFTDDGLRCIGLDNGLAPNMRQAIIWTNADPIHWRIYASLGGDELRLW